LVCSLSYFIVLPSFYQHEFRTMQKVACNVFAVEYDDERKRRGADNTRPPCLWAVIYAIDKRASSLSDIRTDICRLPRSDI